MNEERLIEIASTISKLNGPLVVLGYLTSLGESDMYLFFRMVRGSKYGKLDYYQAIKKFCDDYLTGKDLDVIDDDLEEFGYNDGNYDEYFSNYNFNNSVMEAFYSETNFVETTNSGKKR